MSIVMLGIDLGKNSCSLAGLDERGAVVLRRRVRRETIVSLTAKLPGCTVAMEACCGAHHLGRVLAAQGHTVKLMSPEYVRPSSTLPSEISGKFVTFVHRRPTRCATIHVTA